MHEKVTVRHSMLKMRLGATPLIEVKMPPPGAVGSLVVPMRHDRIVERGCRQRTDVGPLVAAAGELQVAVRACIDAGECRPVVIERERQGDIGGPSSAWLPMLIVPGTMACPAMVVVKCNRLPA